MLLRIFFVVYLMVNVANAGPVTKIAKHSNDLTEDENIVISSATDDLPDIIYDTSNFDKPKIYEDVANLEIIPKPSILTKRMVAASSAKKINSKHDLITYVSKNIASEMPDMNLTDNVDDLERIVGTVLKLYGKYYDKKATEKPVNLDDMEMMSDQPMNDDGGFKKISVPTFDEQPTVRNAITSSSERPTSVTTREDVLNKEIRKKARDMYLNAYKSQLLANFNKPDRPLPPGLKNLTISLPQQSMFNNSDSQYTKKIRSFYPICDIPKNTKDAWKEENILNLFFNVDYNQNTTIATATLRLHRLPRENQTDTYLNPDICPENSIFQEEEKLIRVSIYWYTKSSKKHSKVKKRLCDSKVINENAQWVELSVKSATKMWTKSGKNMGLAILVEDQDGSMLKASKYFKGATCTVGTVGTPTPRPIPTLLTDTAKQINDSTGIFTLLGFNKTGSIPSDFGLLPKIDVCVLELPGQIPLVQLNRSDCKLNNSLNEFDLSILTSHHHHIRHQKHLENEQEAANYDVRKNIINKKIILSKDLLEKFNNGSINR